MDRLDKLEQQLRESSNHIRHFEPPPGQWETIREQIDQPENGGATDGSSTETGRAAGSSFSWPGTWWPGLATVALLVAFILSQTFNHQQNAPTKASEATEQISPSSDPISPEQINATVPQAELPINVPGNSVLSEATVETTTSPLTANSEQTTTGPSNSSPAIISNSGDIPIKSSQPDNSSRSPANITRQESSATKLPSNPQPSATTSEPDLPQAAVEPTTHPLVPTTLPEPAGSNSIVTTNDSETGRATPPELALQYNFLPITELADRPIQSDVMTSTFQTRMDQWVDGLQPQALDAFKDSGFNHRENYSKFRKTSSSARWEGDLHILAFPVSDYTSVRGYTTATVEGADVFSTSFGGMPLTLFEVEGPSGENGAVWFTSAHIGISRRFKNGFRLGAGLSYSGTDLFKGSINSERLVSSDESIYYRYGVDQGSVSLINFSAEYLFMRRHRFRISLGASLLIPISISDRYQERLLQPATEEEEVLSQITYSYDYIGSNEPEFFPQLGFEYQLGNRTTLSLAAGVRMGLGLRYWIGPSEE